MSDTYPMLCLILPDTYPLRIQFLIFLKILYRYIFTNISQIHLQSILRAKESLYYTSSICLTNLRHNHMFFVMHSLQIIYCNICGGNICNYTYVMITSTFL